MINLYVSSRLNENILNNRSFISLTSAILTLIALENSKIPGSL